MPESGYSDLLECYFRSIESPDEIVAVIDEMPDIKYAHVKSDFVEELNELRPEITFIGE